MALGDSPARGRMMESEKHRYVPIEERYTEPCRSGSSGGRCGGGDNDHPLLKDVFCLEHIGQVEVTLLSTNLTWTSVEDQPQDTLSCWGTVLKDTEGNLPIAEIFAVKALILGSVNEAESSICGGSLAPKQLHRVEVHTFLRLHGKWVPKVHRFGNSCVAVAQDLAQRIQTLLLHETCRPKTLLVFVNPYGGKKAGVPTWKQVAPLFELAKIKVKVITTERAGHARDVMSKATKDDLNALDGVIGVGGDGFFNEVVNGLVMHRHKAQPAYMPRRLDSFYKKKTVTQQRNEQAGLKQLLAREADSSDQRPFLETGQKVAVDASGACSSDVDLEDPNTTLVNSNPNLRIGLIPAGSTDTVVVSTTGSRDPTTSALHIILGDSMPLDIVRITGWRNQHENSAAEVPEVRYAASFAGYGFYGDVMRESENLRWMGPARYDMAGFKVFMKHKSYEGEISFLDMPQSEPQAVVPQGPWSRNNSSFKARHSDDEKKVVCLANCAICSSGFDFSHVLKSDNDTEERNKRHQDDPRWRTCRTKFLSVGAAVMSCRNDKAPEGVAAHAHLADGMLHLILIRECSHFDYLRQLVRLARRGADPFDFEFVDYYKTPLFTFTSVGHKESVWTVDGELLPVRHLTGQVFRGLVNLFARGPET